MFNVKQSASIEINQKISELKNKGKKTTILSLGEAFFDIPLRNKKFLKTVIITLIVREFLI